MRIAVISDIHGNDQALTAVLRDIERSSVDLVICLGDVATLGPSPKMVTEKVRLLNCPCIIGNHEEALSDPDNCDKYDIKGELLQNTIRWCLDNLSIEDMEFFEGFSPNLTLNVDEDRSVIFYHGSPNSSTQKILPQTSSDELDRLISAEKKVCMAVGGHTHVQMHRKHRNIQIVNPGSVGCAFSIPPAHPPSPSLLAVAEYAVLDFSGDVVQVELKSVPFDIKALLAILRSTSLPLREWWIDEYTRLGF